MGKDDIWVGVVTEVRKKRLDDKVVERKLPDGSIEKKYIPRHEHLLILRGLNKALKVDFWWFLVPVELWEEAQAMDGKTVYVGAYTGKRDHALHLAEISEIRKADYLPKQVSDPLVTVVEG